MTALAATKLRDRKGAEYPDSPGALGMKAATRVWGGGMVVNDAGVLAPMRTATGLKCLGVAIRDVDNSGGAANAIPGEYKKGVFGPFTNSASGDLITAADIGSDCYGVDDDTVAKTDNSGARSVAGRIESVDASGVYVKFADN